MWDVFEGKEDQWGDLEVCCHILFLFSNSFQHGGCQYTSKSHLWSHHPLLLKYPWWFPVPWTVVLSLPEWSPSSPLGTKRWLSQKCFIFSIAWGIPIIEISCSLQQTHNTFLGSLSWKCSHHPPPNFPNISCLYCSFGLVSNWHDFFRSCWSCWLVCVLLCGFVLSLLEPSCRLAPCLILL